MPFLLPAVVGLLGVVTWFFAVAGYALRDFSRNRIDELCQNRGVSHRFRDILDYHQQALVTMELGVCATFLALVGLIFYQAESWSLLSNTQDPISWISFIAQLLGLVLGLMIWVVVIPRTWARVGGEKFIVRMWPLIRIAHKIVSPILKGVAKFDRMAHRMAGVPEPTTGTLPSLTQEILSVVDEGQRDGLIEPQARKMIRRVMELQEEDVAAIMTPRTEMHVLQVDTPLDQARTILLDGGHSRVPVVGESTDDIIGILYAKDLLHHLDNTNGKVVSLKDIVREAIYIPETTGIDTLLERMKREHVHIAIVIDEYSGVAGLVTLEDILEEIVGEITDEYDPEEEEDIHQISNDVIEVDARVHVDELNEQFEFDLPEDGDFETIGGFVFNQLGRVPKKSEAFNWRNLRVTVLNVGKRKIHKLRIEIDRTVAATATEEV
ncbi:MAG: HlyC/CorC family transporter [Planctomycetaceae bacterium]|nr:HlyC/CorC family transporter [Planctomycetaceae bacterium]